MGYLMMKIAECQSITFNYVVGEEIALKVI